MPLLQSLMDFATLASTMAPAVIRKMPFSYQECNMVVTACRHMHKDKKTVKLWHSSLYLWGVITDSQSDKPLDSAQHRESFDCRSGKIVICKKSFHTSLVFLTRGFSSFTLHLAMHLVLIFIQYWVHFL